MFDPPLSPLEQRVLGCLMEKQLSTPEYYPLTLNALVNACNQSTNRDPVMQLDPPSVEEALDSLQGRHLAWAVNAPGSRALKFEHRVAEAFELSLQEEALLAELLLRGPQTAGELRGRCTRMYAFQDLAEVETALGLLAGAPEPLAGQLPRQPGTKEARYGHLLGGAPEACEVALAPASAPGRTAHMETELAALRRDLEALREEFAAFRKQFE